jgi:hypothetical protein
MPVLYFDGVIGDFTRLPCFTIFDETTRLRGPLASSSRKFGWFAWFSGCEWSRDNSQEIEKGWILKGDTVAELAARLGMKPGDLEATVSRLQRELQEAGGSRFRSAEGKPGGDRKASVLCNEAFPDHGEHPGRPQKKQQVPGAGSLRPAHTTTVHCRRTGFVLGMDVQRRWKQRRVPLHGANRRAQRRCHEAARVAVYDLGAISRPSPGCMLGATSSPVRRR